MPAPVIAYAHVGKTFDGGRGAERVVAVDDVSLEVAEGEFLAIVGGSGSGKTTLLRLANRLIEADSGAITVEGEDVRNVDPILLRRRIGYVFQSGGLFPHLTVAGNIGITPKLLGTPPADIAARVDELLDLVRLDRAQYRDRLPHELSGGQRQRVGVARALAAKPRIVLFVNVRISWLRRPNSVTRIYDWYPPYLQKNYRAVGLLDLTSPQGSRWLDASAPASEAQNIQNCVMVYERIAGS